MWALCFVLLPNGLAVRIRVMEHLNDADVARLCHELPTEPGLDHEALRREAEVAISSGLLRIALHRLSKEYEAS
jgi:hypothetical protein